MRLAVAAVLWGLIAVALGDEPRAAPQSQATPEKTLSAKAPPEKTLPEKKLIVRQLPIPPRLQWTSRGGYCGECSIQQSLLYFGGYVSQYVCRKIIDRTQEQDVLVGVNADVVLKALRLEFEEFDTSKTPAPQYKTYLRWTKQHLHEGHPVIMAVFDRDANFRDYDHITLSTGFHAKDAKIYHPDDTLFFNDHLTPQPQRRPFKTLHDTRGMRGNGAEHQFCIPANYAFGCAVTGLKDETGALLPVRVGVDCAHEPDVVEGAAPVELKLTVAIGSLKPGKPYVLYRYDDYKMVPTRNYDGSKYHSARSFVAERTWHEFQDKCLSNGVSLYRCLADDRR